MPDKQAAELQFARAMAQAPHPVHLTLARPESHVSRHTSAEHIERFYRTIPELYDGDFDALIVTGAPVETLDFEEVDYWAELQGSLDWAERRVPCALYICWGARPRSTTTTVSPRWNCLARLPVFSNRPCTSPAVRSSQDWASAFQCLYRATPMWNRIISGAVSASRSWRPRRKPVCVSSKTRPRGALMMFNHLEYDTFTLDTEYHRDRKAGMDVSVPEGYYPQDDAARLPVNTWAPAARTFYANWVNEVAEVNSARRTADQRAVMPYAVAG